MILMAHGITFKMAENDCIFPLGIAVRSKYRLSNILEFYSFKHVSRIYHSQLITNGGVII